MSFADRIRAKAAAARTASVIPATTLEEGIEPTATAAEKSNTYARMTRKQPTEMPNTTSEVPSDENIGVVVPVIVTTTAAAATTEPAPTPEPAPVGSAPTGPVTVALPGGGTGIVLSSLARRGSLAVTEETLTQPAVNTRPSRSYKIPMGPYAPNQPINWLMQQGAQGAREPLARTSNGGIRPVGGGLIDFHLTISPTSDNRDRSHDWRLAAVFIEPDGSIAEVNLNCCNSSRDDGELYVTSTARSLLAALMAAAHSGDDMEALTTGCRFTAIAGKRAAFINLEVYAELEDAERGEWLQMRGNLTDAPSDPLEFADQLTALKRLFRADGLLQGTPAVQGDLPGRQVLEAQAAVVD